MNRSRFLKGMLCLSAMGWQLWAGQSPIAAPLPGSEAVNTSTTANSDDLKVLRERIAKQEEAIKQLQQSMAEERSLLEKAVQTSNAAAKAVSTVNAASNTNASSDAPVQLVPVANVARPRLAWGRQNLQAANPSPLSISIGDSTFTPLGFVDATFYGRSTNLGSGIGTNFAAIPYINSASAHLAENSFSTQNSRIGFRVDSKVLGAKVLGYFEADFLGNQPTNVFVTSNADTFRMRNIFVDVQRNGLEFLAGQDWSMFTPNRKGLSPLPADIFYTQNMDTNYQAGLVWSRQTQFRLIAHPNENVAFGVSLENPQQYVGGSAGAPTVTYPTALATALGTEFNNGTNSFAVPNLHPDILFKAAFDGHVADKVMHVEAGGMVRSFHDSIGVGTPVNYRSSTATAGSGEVNANLEVVKNFRIIANTFFGSGNGRYVFGLAPDAVVRADGTISPVHTYSTVDGFELNLTKNTLLTAYYGGVYIGRNSTVDTNGKLVGYGYAGSGPTNNRTIQEGTIGITQTFWKNPNYGALSLITQYSYLTRNPWAVATGSPKETHTNMYWLDFRYTLP